MGTIEIRMTTVNYDKLNEIAAEIDAWGRKNFPIRIPRMGVLEEIGELAHAFLKRAQGIRDMDKPELFLKATKDAVADCMVYLMHDMFIQNVQFEPDDFDELPDEPLGLDLAEDMQELFGEIASYAGDLLIDDTTVYGKLTHGMRLIAQHCEFDFMEAVESTWARVKTRDWKKNPSDAHTVAGD
jgi:NTP pyrophosphatase (non-canonical NTP hydrolase)